MISKTVEEEANVTETLEDFSRWETWWTTKKELVTEELHEGNFMSPTQAKTSVTSMDKFWCYTTDGDACVFPFNYFDYSWHRWRLLS